MSRLLTTAQECPLPGTGILENGTNSTEQNPEHTYSTAGNYTVTLTASNAGGTDTNTKENYISITKVSALSTLSSQILIIYAFICKFIASVNRAFGK